MIKINFFLLKLEEFKNIFLNSEKVGLHKNCGGKIELYPFACCIEDEDGSKEVEEMHKKFKTNPRNINLHKLSKSKSKLISMDTVKCNKCGKIYMYKDI